MAKNDLKNINELKILTRYIFQGFTISQIATEMNYSKSTVSYKMKKLFEKYNSKTRLQFAISVFGEILEKTKQELEQKIKENIELKSKLNI